MTPCKWFAAYGVKGIVWWWCLASGECGVYRFAALGERPGVGFALEPALASVLDQLGSL